MALLRKRLCRTIHHQSYRKKTAFPPPSCVCHTAGKPLPPREKHSAASRNSTFRHAEKHLPSCGKAPFAVPNSTFRIAERAFQRICFVYIVYYQQFNKTAPKLTYLPPKPCPAANNSLSRTSHHTILHNHTHISAYLFIPACLPLTAICAVTPVPYRSRLSVCRQPEHCPSRSP